MENSDRIEKLKVAKAPIENVLTSVFVDFSRSQGKLYFPEPVLFQNGTKIDSFYEKDVEKVIRDGVEKGQIFLAVDANFVGQTFVIKKIKAGIGAVILGLFPENFIAKCNESGIRPEQAMKDCLTKVILEDMRIGAQKLPRGAIGGSHKSLVGVFNAKIT